MIILQHLDVNLDDLKNYLQLLMQIKRDIFLHPMSPQIL